MKKIFLSNKAVNLSMGLLLFFVVAIAIIDKLEFVRKWLDVNNPIQTKILIVEGWITPYNYNTIVKIFENGNYEKMLITGSSFSESLTLFQNGSIIIKPDSTITKVNPDYLQLQLLGSQASNVYPHVIVSLNNTVLSDLTIKRTRWINTNCSIKSGDSIVIRYLNDGISKYRDRNLTLRKIKINGQNVIPRSKFVSYKTHQIYMPAFSKSYPDEMAESFRRMGIPSDNIVALPSKNNGKSRTYTASRNAIEWLHAHNCKNANLVTLNFHSRRSKLSYFKIDPEINIGVISLQDKSPYRWFKSKLRTIKELISIFLLKIIPASLL